MKSVSRQLRIGVQGVKQDGMVQLGQFHCCPVNSHIIGIQSFRTCETNLRNYQLMIRITTLLLTIASLTVSAQQNVVLQIEHFLGGVPFASNVTALNGYDEDFRASRMEYYLSEFTLIHDGGQETNVDATWVLVDAHVMTTVPLGNFDITALEAVRFGVGVDPAVNHLDPASYEASHPLAPKSPSMHWGWAAGYRFLAMEGTSGINLAQSYEIHALGDNNYLKQTIPTAGVMDGGDLVVQLNGDYVEAFREMSIGNGPIVHGETGLATIALRNFRDHVFTSIEGNGPVGMDELNKDLLVVYPNPTTDQVRISTTGVVGYDEVRVLDAQGKLVQSTPFTTGKAIDVALPISGVYQVSLLQKGTVVARRTVVKQ